MAYTTPLHDLHHANKVPLEKLYMQQEIGSKVEGLNHLYSARGSQFSMFFPRTVPQRGHNEVMKTDSQQNNC